MRFFRHTIRETKKKISLPIPNQANAAGDVTPNLHKQNKLRHRKNQILIKKFALVSPRLALYPAYFICFGNDTASGALIDLLNRRNGKPSSYDS